jgi:surface polysaccharide O-acyltransferase-like enzyme
MEKAASMEPRIAEFDWLKALALFLLIFVHSDLYVVFPEVILPLKWFMVSSFFFVSGFLAFNSFHKREVSIRVFFKTKILLLYIPFLAASLLYFVIKTTVGMVPVNLVELLSNITLLNIFNLVNSVYNWGFLWFIPYLLVFMMVFCFLEKYVKNVKIQVLLVSVLWFATILAWVYESPMRPDQLFSQYFLVFMIGVWFNKLGMYEKAMHFKTAVVTVPLVALFALDFSSLFTFNNTTETLKALFYANGRSMILSLSAILLVLLFLRKTRFPRNRFVELIATTSIFIYLLDPFFSFLLGDYIFGQPTIYVADGMAFYLYQTARIFILFVLLPPAIKAIRGYIKK